ncbi:restriction endonuclease subunit S [Nostoc sp.]|uniref:restriction endonuclease subunit S n=1 Tax=Nostoc sp. TaxID=1180 RepID=UPI002FF5A112
MKTDEVYLGTVATITMGTSPKGETYNNQGVGLPLLNGPTEFGITHPTCTLFTTDSKKECQTGDLIFCVRGSTTGRMNWADKPYSLGRGVCSIRGKNLADTKFIRYCIELKLDALLNLSGGATFPNLTRDDITNFPIPYPIYRQKTTAILSAYNDLIENNTRRIKILEEMAQTLYHEWFVKFRFPGHKHTKMADSELGLIPEGWEVRKLGDITKVISGFAFKSKDFQDEGIPVIKIKNIRTGTVDISDIQCVNSSFLSLNSKYHVKRGDLLISLTGSHLTQPNSVVGRVAVYSQSKKVCLLNQRAGKIFITNSDRCKISYLFYLLSSEDKRRSIALMASGAASQANISPTQVESLNLLIPRTEILNLFHQIISPIFEQISNLEIKNSNLRKTRDLLLPKLISGEIDVERLEITTEDIAA